MKAIILAAGRGVRMTHLTNHIPKPLVKILGVPILNRIIFSLPDEVDELIVVVGYLKEKIKAYLGSEFLGRKITYVTQLEQQGTFHALKLCEGLVKEGEQFFVLYADDIHGACGIKDCLKYEHALIVEEADDPTKFGVVRVDSKNRILEIIEKPKKPTSNLVSTGVILTNSEIFKYGVDKIKGEYFLSEAVSKMAKAQKVYAVKSTLWLPIGYPADVKNAEQFFIA